MNSQDITLIIQGIAAGLLAMIPVYQKWKAATRTETLADKAVGLGSGNGGNALTKTAKKEAAYSVLMTWEARASILLGAVLTLSAVNSFLNARRAVKIIDTQRAEISAAVDSAQKDRRLIIENIQAISTRLDKLDSKK